MPIRIVKDDEKKPGGFSSTQQKGNIVKGKLKSQKELKKITSSDEYKKADYKGKTKMLNVATHLTGGQAKLDKNKNNRIDAQDFKILRQEKAKGRGQGLQDEKMKPGKPMKAVLGALALGASGALGLKKVMGKKKSATAKPNTGLMPVGDLVEQKKKQLAGKKKGGMFHGYSKVFDTAVKAGEKASGTSTIVGVKPNPKKSVAKSKKKTFKSMEEMRKAKGFKPGESASEFNKRRMKLAGAKKALAATKVGKMLLPVAAAGVAAQQYLKSKMKKKDKKMVGGMMQKYAEGGPAARSSVAEQKRRMGRRKLQPGVLGRAGQSAGPKAGKKKDDPYKNIIITKGGMYSYTKPEIDEKKGRHYRQHKSYDASPRLISDAKGKTMSMRSMNVGGSVTVKTKLGRNKPTKMY